MEQTLARMLAAAHASVQQDTVGPSTLTNDRLWAATAAVLALVGVVIGGMSLARSGGRIGTIVALVAGLVAAVIGGLVLATADAGPGSGNGVVGAGAALVLGLIAMAVGGLALARDVRGAR